MNDKAHLFAKIRAALETSDTRDAMNQVQDLVAQLGGTADLSRMSAGAVAIYLVSLALSAG